MSQSYRHLASQTGKKKENFRSPKKMRQYDENHRKLFSKPAKTCVLCGYPMDYQGHKATEWEIKWSTHAPCHEKALKMLDRESGIARERKR